ncbi:MAG: 30S ribosomal protein S17 [Mycoplasma sp.]
MTNQEQRINRRKLLVGVVTSVKMQKTITVNVETKSKHPLYKKLVIKHKKYHAHDENSEASLGDKVEIIETRPLSKTKCFRLNRIIEKAK